MKLKEIIGHAYEALVNENKALNQFITDKQRETARKAIEEAFGERDAQPAPAANEDECDCPVCTTRRAIEKAMYEAKVAKQGEDMVAKAMNQASDAKRAEKEGGPVNVEQGAVKAPHPWDVEVPPEAGNPLGSTARCVIDVLRKSNAEFARELNELKSQVANQVSATASDVITRNYQVVVATQIDRLWGASARHNLQERVQRFLEEAIELAQACDFPSHQILPLITWVYSRPKGSLGREVGGTMVTLAGLCGRISVNLPFAARQELDRISAKTPEEMRERHDAKPHTIRSV